MLGNAIALNSMAFNAARVVGPALAGVIIAIGTGLSGSATTGVAVNLLINTVTYAGVLTGLLRMNPREIRRSARPEQHPPVLESLREGIAHAVRTPLVPYAAYRARSDTGGVSATLVAAPLRLPDLEPAFRYRVRVLDITEPFVDTTQPVADDLVLTGRDLSITGLQLGIRRPETATVIHLLRVDGT